MTVFVRKGVCDGVQMGFLKLSIIFFVLLRSFVHEAAAEELSWKTVNMATVVEAQSEWAPETAAVMVERANTILSRCRVSVHLQGPVIFYLGQMTMDYDSIGLANQFYQQVQKPVLFLIKNTQYNGSAGWAPGGKYLFISHYSQSEAYQKARHPEYEILAHELGHMLGGLTHLTGDEKNLMAGYIANQSADLTQDQCLKIRSSDQFANENYF